jgi:hypothetical protein
MEIIQNTYLLFNYMKKYGQYVNQYNFNIAYQNLIHHALNNSIFKSEDQRNAFRDKAKEIDEVLSELTDNGYYEKLVLLEGKLLALAEETRHFYGKATADRIDTIVTEILVFCNEGTIVVADFTTFHLEGIQAFGDQLGRKVLEKTKEIDQLNHKYIGYLKDVFS